MLTHKRTRIYGAICAFVWTQGSAFLILFVVRKYTFSIVLSLLVSCLVEAGVSDRPNVLFIVVDDLNNDLGCYGHPLVRSPQIDSLAARGVLFERAYCQYPLCNPTRASFLSGLRPDSTRVYDNGVHFRTAAPDIATLPEHFRRNGYTTAGIGKLFHDGVPKGGEPLTDPQSWDFVLPAHGRENEEIEKIHSLISGRVGGTVSWLADDGNPAELTDAVRTTEAIRWLSEYRDSKPFFLAVGFYRPHTPYVAPVSFFDAHPIDRVELFGRPFEDRDDIPLAALHDKREQLFMTDQQRREAIQGYHASTSFMDDQVGRLLKKLEELKLTSSTVVVLVSDHGYHLSEHGLWQKRSLFEESARVPLIIATPESISAGETCERLVELVDLYPTLVDLCSLPDPGHLEGRSLRPLLENPEADFRKDALTQTVCATHSLAKPDSPHGYSLRTERYRYTEWSGGAEGVELYDHAIDPVERSNRAFDPKYIDVVSEHRQRLRARVANGGNEPSEETVLSGKRAEHGDHRIVLLGDFPRVDNPIASQLQRRLSRAGLDGEVTNLGIENECTDQALDRMGRIIAMSPKPDLVALMFGKSDSAVDPDKVTTRIPVAKFRSNLIGMITQLRKAGMVAVLMTTPIYGETAPHNGIGEHPNISLTRYNGHVRRIADELDVALVDHAKYWALQRDSGIDFGKWTSDRHDLSPEGQHQFVLRMLPAVAWELGAGKVN